MKSDWNQYLCQGKIACARISHLFNVRIASIPLSTSTFKFAISFRLFAQFNSIECAKSSPRKTTWQKQCKFMSLWWIIDYDFICRQLNFHLKLLSMEKFCVFFLYFFVLGIILLSALLVSSIDQDSRILNGYDNRFYILSMICLGNFLLFLCLRLNK